MRRLGLQGARRGKTVRTTIPDRSVPCPLDRVNRQFTADRPNQLWVSDFTYVSTWQGWLYVAFVVDVFARRIVGWRVSRTMTTDFVLDALEQALYARQPDEAEDLIHHSAVCVDPLHGTPGRGRHRSISGQQRRQLRQRPGRDHQWPLQSGIDPSSWPLENNGIRGVGHAAMGVLVQPSAAIGTTGVYPAGRS